MIDFQQYYRNSWCHHISAKQTVLLWLYDETDFVLDFRCKTDIRIF